MGTKKTTPKTKATKTKAKAGTHAACGAELQKGATFCWHCRAPLTKAKKKSK